MSRLQRDMIVPYGAAILVAAGMLFFLIRPGGSTANEEAAIRAVIREDALTSKPASCTRLYTSRFLAQFEKSDDPLAACLKNAETRDATSFHIVSLEVSGNYATASVTYRPDDSPISAATIELVKAPTWKFDRALDLTVDMPKLVKLTRTELLHDKDTRSLANCVADELRDSGQRTVDQASINGGYVDMVQADAVKCTPPSALRHAAIHGLRAGVIRKGGSATEADCLASRVVKQMSNSDLRSFSLGHHERMTNLARQAVPACRAVGSGV